MKILKKIVVTIAIFALILSFAGFTTRLEAAVLPSYGGFEVFAIPCTCTAGLMAWHFYAPFYYNTSVPIAGALVGFWYTALPSYTIRPGQYQLGTFTPGAGVCLIGVPPYCYTLPGYGFINPLQTGSSL